MNSTSKEIKSELLNSKLLSTLIIVIMLLPIVISLVKEYQILEQYGNGSGLSDFLISRYDDPLTIFIDVLCFVLILAFVVSLLRLNRKIKNSLTFVEIATSANLPLFVLKSDKSLYWTNIGDIQFSSEMSPADCVDSLISSNIAQQTIEQSLLEKETCNYEIETVIDGKPLWLHITTTYVNPKNPMVCATISDISNMKEASKKIDNQQRELQMQNEMLSLITAQMEVQQVGMKEQTEVLKQQQHRLEIQAQELKDAFSELERRNSQILTKTNYITDSIKYAQTIQEAMLPDEVQLNGFFEHFIIYKPKDIVSGDFYWLSISEDYIFVVLGDCTGHGVPGAFMSMIGIRILGELINENKIKRPSVILEAMHCKIQAALKQDVTENNDGMDIAICRFERMKDKPYDWSLQYAGAKQPVFIKRKDKNEVEVVEPDRRGIGGQTIAEIFFFKDKNIELNNGDRIYITSDGVKDQNNIMRKRFGTQRIRMALSMTSTEKIEDQKNTISQLLKNWQGLEEQRDDISLLGFELSDNVHATNYM